MFVAIDSIIFDMKILNDRITSETQSVTISGEFFRDMMPDNFTAKAEDIRFKAIVLVRRLATNGSSKMMQDAIDITRMLNDDKLVEVRRMLFRYEYDK